MLEQKEEGKDRFLMAQFLKQSMLERVQLSVTSDSVARKSLTELAPRGIACDFKGLRATTRRNPRYLLADSQV